MPPRLELSSTFYRLEAIRQAAVAFSELARVTVEPGSTRHVVRFEAVGAADLELVPREFANWVLVAGEGADRVD